MHQERRIRNLHQLDTIDVSDYFDDLLAVCAGNGADSYVANNEVVTDRDDIDRADISARAANRRRQFPKRSGTRRKSDAKGQAITCSWGWLHNVSPPDYADYADSSN